MDNNFDELIDLNKRMISQNNMLIKQNEEIINLLKNLVDGSKEDGAGMEYVVMGENKNIEIDVDISAFEDPLDVGEVITVANSIDGELCVYKLSAKKSDGLKVEPSAIEENVKDYLNEFDDINFEITLVNLIGNAPTTQFSTSLLVALESLNQNIPIKSGICILGNTNGNNSFEFIDDLSEILRISIENGVKTVYLPMNSAIGVVHAPPMIMDYLTFYKSTDDALNKIFEKIE